MGFLDFFKGIGGAIQDDVNRSGGFGTLAQGLAQGVSDKFAGISPQERFQIIQAQKEFEEEQARRRAEEERAQAELAATQQYRDATLDQRKAEAAALQQRFEEGFEQDKELAGIRNEFQVGRDEAQHGRSIDEIRLRDQLADENRADSQAHSEELIRKRAEFEGMPQFEDFLTERKVIPGTFEDTVEEVSVPPDEALRNYYEARENFEKSLRGETPRTEESEAAPQQSGGLLGAVGNFLGGATDSSLEREETRARNIAEAPGSEQTEREEAEAEALEARQDFEQNQLLNEGGVSFGSFRPGEEVGRNSSGAGATEPALIETSSGEEQKIEHKREALEQFKGIVDGMAEFDPNASATFNRWMSDPENFDRLRKELGDDLITQMRIYYSDVMKSEAPF